MEPRRTGMPSSSVARRAKVAWIVVMLSTQIPAQEEESLFFDRAPFLQQLTATSVIVVSQSSEERAAALRLRADEEEVLFRRESEPGHDHVFHLDGLSAGAEYEYEVSHEDRSWSGRFRTAPGDDRPWRFAVLGDSGYRESADERVPQDEVADVLRAEEPDLLLHTGDLAYPEGHPRTYQENFFDVYADLLASVPILPVVGNHDCDVDLRYYLDAFHLPENGPETPELHYSFDVRNVHVVGLSTCDDLAPEVLAWLEGDLEATSQPWKVVVVHNPPYSIGPYGSDETLKKDLVPLLERGGVDLVFSGHEHLYERTYPVRGGRTRLAYLEPQYVRPDGVIYVVAGGGGASLYNPSPFLFRPDRPLFRLLLSVYHAVLVDVRSNELELRTIDLNGVVVDRFVITKDSRPPPALAYRVGDANENGVVNLTDAIAMLTFLFGGQGEICSASTDVDASEDLDLSDPILVLSALFLGWGLPGDPLGICVERTGVETAGCKTQCGTP